MALAALKRRTTDFLSTIPSLPSLPTRPVSGTWQKIDDIAPIPRSSHTVNVVGGSAYVFGGEINPREPVDNHMHIIGLPYSSASADYYAVPARADEATASKLKSASRKIPDILSDDEGSIKSIGKSNDESDDDLDEVPLGNSPDNSSSTTDKGKGIEDKPTLDNIPAPRVGHASAVIGNRIFMFGGGSGPAMNPLDEGGRIWVFDTRNQLWSYLDPVSPISSSNVIPRPAPRSYHTAVATDTPKDFKSLGIKRTKTWAEWAAGDIAEIGTPQSPIVGNIAEKAKDEDEEGYGTLIIHGGCLAGIGQRANDIWAFDVRSCVWQQLPAAPGASRGGAALCISDNRLFRFGGYDGKGEIGGKIDILQLGQDNNGLEPTIEARGEWLTLEQPRTAEGKPLVTSPWPKPRSVTKLVPMVSRGKPVIALFMGESEASSMGHAGAGKFFDDIWIFQVPPKNATTQTEAKWVQVNVSPYDNDESDEMPKPRGWMDAEPMTEIEENAVVMWGGLSSNNQRLGDGWIFRLE